MTDDINSGKNGNGSNNGSGRNNVIPIAVMVFAVLAVAYVYIFYGPGGKAPIIERKTVNGQPVQPQQSQTTIEEHNLKVLKPASTEEKPATNEKK